jgi:hypothetical protein
MGEIVSLAWSSLGRMHRNNLHIARTTRNMQLLIADDTSLPVSTEL